PPGCGERPEGGVVVDGAVTWRSAEFTFRLRTVVDVAFLEEEGLLLAAERDVLAVVWEAGAVVDAPGVDASAALVDVVDESAVASTVDDVLAALLPPPPHAPAANAISVHTVSVAPTLAVLGTWRRLMWCDSNIPYL